MTHDEMNKITEKIADHYGLSSQLDIFQEECAELIVAVSKYKREKSPETTQNIGEEMADVYIMLNQILYLLNKNNHAFNGLVWYQIEKKLNRQLERMSDDHAI